jgi:hypothetical protein
MGATWGSSRRGELPRATTTLRLVATMMMTMAVVMGSVGQLDSDRYLDSCHRRHTPQDGRRVGQGSGRQGSG